MMRDVSDSDVDIMNATKLYLLEIEDISESYAKGLEEDDKLEMTMAFADMRFLAFRMLAEIRYYSRLSFGSSIDEH